MVGNQQETLSLGVPSQPTGNSLDDDGHPKRTGTVFTASARITTGVIGSGVLSMAWAMAQLGLIAGPVVILFFSSVTFLTSILLVASYRSGDPVSGDRNYTYMDAVQNIIGGVQAKLCRLIQYLHLFGLAIGYTITAAISMRAIQRSNCFHSSGGKNQCNMNINPYVISFGVLQILFSQIPNVDKLSCLSIIAAVMSIIYPSVCIGLGIAKVAENGNAKGSLTGIRIGVVTKRQKIWRIFEAFGNIAFAYSFPIVLFEVQDTLKSPPSEEKTMKKASLVSVGVITLFFMLCGCVGYAAFGDMSPNNLLTGLGFYNPYWLLDIANAAVVVHNVREYQLACQPIFAFIEKQALVPFPATERDIKFRIPGFKPTFRFNLLRLICRTLFVMLATMISMLLPFFNDVTGLVGALGFWPLTVYFPVEMYIKQRKIPKWSKMWVCLQLFSLACLAVSIAGAAGSVAGVVFDIKRYN